MQTSASGSTGQGADRPPATLAAVAGRLTALLGAAALPLYAAGFLLTEGWPRWLVLGLTTALAGSALAAPTRRQQRHEAPLAMALCVAMVVLWAALIPANALLLSMGLAVSMVYLGLMVPRPHAELGIAASAAAFASSYLVFAPEVVPVELAGTTATALTLGGLVLGIRINTERRVTEHNRSLADVNARLERLSELNPLTGLANRRRLRDVLDHTWERARDSGSPVGAIMIDIDFFKQYNDHFGHLAGDDCLQAVAAAVAGTVRDTDMVARYGGEELAVVLPNADLASAHRTAERIRAAVSALRAPHPASATGFLTVSAGVATSAALGGAQPDDLLERADRCLYAAKNGGRNRVAVAA